MKPNDYQQMAMQTAGPMILEDPLYSAVGLVEECGEFCGQLKHQHYHQWPEDKDAKLKELGDVLWYLTAAITLHAIRVGDLVVGDDLDDIQKSCVSSRRYLLDNEVGAAIYLTKAAAAYSSAVADAASPGMTKVKISLSDTFAMLCVVVESQGFTLNEVAERNIAKLKERYPEGFSSEASLNRKEHQV